MFRNYLVTALRNIARHRLYSVINIAGLAVGLACAVFIILFIRDEISYDKWIPDSENLYRVEHTFTAPSQAPMPNAGSPYPVVVAMQQQLPLAHRQLVEISRALCFFTLPIGGNPITQTSTLPLARIK